MSGFFKNLGSKLQNEFTNADSDLLSGRFAGKIQNELYNPESVLQSYIGPDGTIRRDLLPAANAAAAMLGNRVPPQARAALAQANALEEQYAGIESQYGFGGAPPPMAGSGRRRGMSMMMPRKKRQYGPRGQMRHQAMRILSGRGLSLGQVSKMAAAATRLAEQRGVDINSAIAMIAKSM